jgi:hypothetical protein
VRNDITIRLSTDADVERLRRLAELDGRHVPHGDVLVAEANGRLLAAIGVDGAVIADPFERTASIVRVLRTHLDGGERRERRRRGWLRRVLPTP